MKNDLMNKPVSNRICVLYEPTEGRVIHVHRVLTMPGSRHVADDELEDRAKDCAKRAGHDVSGFSTLRVAGEDYDGSIQYRVDLEKKKLHAIKHHPASSLNP